MEEGGTEMKPIGIVKEMENVTQEQPAKALPGRILENGFETFSLGHPQNQIREIDPGVNGQLQ